MGKSIRDFADLKEAKQRVKEFVGRWEWVRV